MLMHLLKHLLALLVLTASAEVQAQSLTYQLGRAPSEDEIRAWDIAISPDGHELPQGSGTAKEGERLYATRCIGCHGPDATGAAAPPLVGRNTVVANWPFATSLWDYINRAMPLYMEGSLSSDEVYALTAYLLFKGSVIGETDVLNRANLPGIEMPNRDGYVPPPISQWEPGMKRLFRLIEP